MDAGEPVVLLGDSGTGNSHLLIGLGLAACEQGYDGSATSPPRNS
jgi:DNA replication protein DnaC